MNNNIKNLENELRRARNELCAQCGGYTWRPMLPELWVAFRDADGNELCSHTVRGTFPGETEATMEFIAEEYGVPKDQITVEIIER